MAVSLIAACAENRVIGGDNKMLWHLPGDFAYFKRMTMDKPVVMGRNTFDSIGKPLAGRTNIVVTRTPNWTADGVCVVDSIDAALAVARAENGDEILVIGGGSVYAQTIHIADSLYITEVDTTVGGDTLFPPIDTTVWRLQSISKDMVENGIPYRFVVYKRDKRQG